MIVTALTGIFVLIVSVGVGLTLLPLVVTGVSTLGGLVVSIPSIRAERKAGTLANEAELAEASTPARQVESHPEFTEEYDWIPAFAAIDELDIEGAWDQQLVGSNAEK